MESTFALTLIEIYFAEKGTLPDPSYLRLKGFKEDPTSLDEQLEARNLPTYTQTKLAALAPNLEEWAEAGFSSAPDPMFILAVGQITNVADPRSLTQKLKEVGLNQGQWNNMLMNSENRTYFAKRMNAVKENFSSLATLGLGKQLSTGDLNAIKYWHEFSGEFKPNNEELLNLRMIVAVLMEILVKYVEPAKLTLIAADIETAVPQLGAGT